MGPRVLMFGWEFPPHNSGGLGTACEGLSRALVGAGAQIIFVLPRRMAVTAPAMSVRFAGLENLTFAPVPSLIRPYVTPEGYARLYATEMLPLYGHSLLEEVRAYAERSRGIAEREAYDLIHAHDWLSFPAGLMAKAVSGKPLVVHVHATEFDRTGGSGVNQAVYEIEREGMRAADAIVAVSDWTKQIIVAHYGVSPDKVQVVHNGVELAPAAARALPALEELKAAGNKIVLFVGRITLQKGPDYFVQLAQRVLQVEPKVYFVMVGAGDMEGQVVRLAAELGISRRFLFPGFLRGEELQRMYAAADLYVLPSVSEPFGITPLEALAAGTPVMVSKQSGVSEVLSHALKVDFWDIEEMANQVVAVLRHPSLQQTLTRYGTEEVKNVSWPRAAERCLELYRRLTPETALA